MRFKPVGKIRSAEAGPSERAFELERVIGPSFRAAYCGSPVVCVNTFSFITCKAVKNGELLL